MTDTTRAIIRDADARYERKVTRAGLYTVAYFGHRGQNGDRSRLGRLWREARREAAEAARERTDLR